MIKLFFLFPRCFAGWLPVRFALLFSCLLSVMPLTAQDNQTHLLLSNSTNLTLNATVTVVGNTDAVQIGKSDILPWELGHYHDISDRVTVTILNIVLGIDISHDEDEYLVRCRRFGFNGSDDYSVEVAISTEGELLFTLLFDHQDQPFSFSNPARYNVRFPDGQTDQAAGYNMLYENRNSPHEATRTITYDGVEYRLIYGTFHDDLDASDNVMFSLSEYTPVSYHFDPDPSDVDDPSVLNALTYNIGLLMPLGANDQEEEERTPVLHTAMPKNMDVIIWQEMFEQYFVNQIIDSMSADYPYHTQPHNQATIPGITKNGGVLIMSKFPIEEEDDFSYQRDAGLELVGESVLSDKGVKYARINKHGQTIHIFGTHTSGQALDNDAMGRWMREKLADNLEDVVIMGGDMNTRLYNNNYYQMIDSLFAVEPTYKTLEAPWDQIRGTVWAHNHYSSGRNDGSGTIDYIFASSRHKIPVLLYNEAQAYRVHSTDRRSWGIFDMGDHQPVYCRMEFPVVERLASDTLKCPGDDLLLEITSDVALSEGQWYFEGEAIEGATDLFLTKQDLTAADWGEYRYEGQYTYAPDIAVNGLNLPQSLGGPYFFPGETVGRVIKRFIVAPDPELCAIATGIEETMDGPLTWYPNPVSDLLVMEIPEAWKREGVQASLFNAGGQLMERRLINASFSWDVSRLAPGNYFISIDTRHNEVVELSFVKH